MGAELRVDTISEKTSSNGVVIDLVTLKDGVISASGINLGNAALVESELEMLDGITAGTVIASKALVADANIDITGGRNITISGELDAATLDISGNADIDGTLEADAITVNGATLAETISDTVGAMVTSNTESGITVTYDDADNTLDFTVGTLNQDTTGTAATVTTAAQSNITSLGTLTTLTVDNIIINGTTIGHTSDTDLITVASDLITVAGEVSMTTLDIGGTNVTSTAAELNYSDLATLGTTAASKVFTANANGLTTVSGSVLMTEDTLTDASTIVWNVITSPVAKVTIADNRTMAAPSGTTPAAGQFVSLLIIQDGSGSRTITWNAVYEFTGDVSPTLTTTAAKGDLFTFRYNGSKWLEIGRNLNLTLS